MKIKCDYCGNTYEDTQEKCPSCGAPNPSHQNSGEPKTIEDLQRWYEARNLPKAEITRFFIGIDYKKPKAIGIYKDENGDFIVYKNKANGERAIRYRGKDEEYAVSEVYQKLKDEIVHQKANSANFSTKKPTGIRGFFKSVRDNWFVAFGIVFFAVGVLGILIDFITGVSNIIQGRHNGYYDYDDSIYYSYNGDWYYYDDDYTYSWTPVSKEDAIPQEIASNYDDYYLSKNWDSSISATNWDDTTYYEETHASTDSDDYYYDDYSNDSDYDWGGSDSWDSGGTDWDSDW